MEEPEECDNRTYYRRSCASPDKCGLVAGLHHPDDGELIFVKSGYESWAVDREVGRVQKWETVKFPNGRVEERMLWESPRPSWRHRKLAWIPPKLFREYPSLPVRILVQSCASINRWKQVC